MKKSMFKRLVDQLKKRNNHVSKSRQFSKLADNPAGTKFRTWCQPESRRGADGTIRR